MQTLYGEKGGSSGAGAGAEKEAQERAQVRGGEEQGDALIVGREPRECLVLARRLGVPAVGPEQIAKPAPRDRIVGRGGHRPRFIDNRTLARAG